MTDSTLCCDAFNTFLNFVIPVNKRILQFRHIHITRISDEQRSHLECPDLEGRPVDESTHKVSPIVSACRMGR